MYHEPAAFRGMPTVGNGAGTDCATSGASVATTASSCQSGCTMNLPLFVVCLLSATVRAQTVPPPAPPLPPPQAPANPNAPEMNTRDETAPAFQSHVTLVMVPVVVRDIHGVAVDNLTKASFQLFDKGKPQEISRFPMEKTGGKPPLIV